MKSLMMSVLILVVLACSGGNTGPPDEPVDSGTLAVTLARTPGAPSLMFSASVKVGSGSPTQMRDGQTEAFPGLKAGTHSVEASNLTANCSIQGQNPRNVSIVADQITTVSIEVTCNFVPEPRIVFVWRKPPYVYDLWTVSPDGTSFRQITHDGGSREPAWSPDGTRILFSRDFDIHIINYDGTEDRIVEIVGIMGITPTWSPDGGKIAYVSSEGGNSVNQIWVMNADGSNPANLATDEEEYLTPDWSHDGQRIACCKASQLITMNIDGTDQLELKGSVGCRYPAWSPDDQEIAFGAETLADGHQIYRIGADGSGFSRLTYREQGSFGPDYLPDGSAIIFHSPHQGADPVERAWIMDVDGGNQRQFDPLPFVGVKAWRWWDN